MLDVLQLSDLLAYQQNMPDGREKDLLNQLLWEYSKYTECGTIEDCQQRKEWMSMSIDDIRKNFFQTVKGMRQEVEYIREDAQTPVKRGRPPKQCYEVKFVSEVPIGATIYVIEHGYVEEAVVTGFKYMHGKAYLISDYGNWWIIGENAWKTRAEAEDAKKEQIRKWKEGRTENESPDQKK